MLKWQKIAPFEASPGKLASNPVNAMRFAGNSAAPTEQLPTTPRRVFPPHIKPPYTQLQIDLAETLGRIADRTDAWAAEKAEMRTALAWCRANGNPHRESSQ